MKKYLVIDFDDANNPYIVDNLKELIEDIYEFELVQDEESFESVSNKFYLHHKVYEVEGTIKELN